MTAELVNLHHPLLDVPGADLVGDVSLFYPSSFSSIEINSVNLKVLRVVVFENMFGSATVPDALDHAGIVALVTEDLVAQHLVLKCRMSCHWRHNTR